MTAQSPAVLITGFHRSGTSAAARVLEHAGLDLGDNLLGADMDNPHGHFEDIDVIAAHDAALSSAGLSWRDPTAAARPVGTLSNDIATYIAARTQTGSPTPWGVKDPRLCLFLDEWLAQLPAANVVVIFRRPDEAIHSLHRRHARRYVDTRQVDPGDVSFWRYPDLGVRLWIHYHEQLLSNLPDRDRVLIVNFADRDRVNGLAAMASNRWGLALAPSDREAVDPTLGSGSAPPVEVRDPRLIDRAAEIFGELSELARP